MRQRGDQTLIILLNNIRIRYIIENNQTISKFRFIDISDRDYSNITFHVWTENAPIEKHNQKMLDLLTGYFKPHHLIKFQKIFAILS